MVKEELHPSGTLTLVLTDEDGNVKESYSHNLVVNTGLSHITSRLIGTGSAVVSHLGVGTGAVAPAGANTTLGTEIGTRSATTNTQVTTTVTNDTVQYVATVAAGNATGAITEAGLFNASTSGTLIARTTFGVINKEAGDTLTVTWKIQFS